MTMAHTMLRSCSACLPCSALAGGSSVSCSQWEAGVEASITKNDDVVPYS